MGMLANTTDTETTLGDLISIFYEEFLALYGDPERASVEAARVINQLLDMQEPDNVLEFKRDS